MILLTACLLCKCRQGQAPVLSFRGAVFTSVADRQVKLASSNVSLCCERSNGRKAACSPPPAENDRVSTHPRAVSFLQIGHFVRQIQTASTIQIHYSQNNYIRTAYGLFKFLYASHERRRQFRQAAMLAYTFDDDDDENHKLRRERQTLVKDYTFELAREVP